MHMTSYYPRGNPNPPARVFSGTGIHDFVKTLPPESVLAVCASGGPSGTGFIVVAHHDLNRLIQEYFVEISHGTIREVGPGGCLAYSPLPK